MGAILKSMKANPILGDTTRVMTASAVDSTGKRWPKGTEYQPASAGAYGQTVTIRGKSVMFLAKGGAQ